MFYNSSPQRTFNFEDLYFYFLNAYEQLGFIEFSKMLLAYVLIGLLFFAILWCIPLTRNIIIMIYNIIHGVYCIIEALLKSVLFFIHGIIFAKDFINNKCRIIIYKFKNHKNEKSRGDYSCNNDSSKSHQKSKEEMYFEVLELEGIPTSESLKKAFKVAIMKYHPDRVASLGVEFQEMAKEKSIVINDAYAFFKSKYGI